MKKVLIWSILILLVFMGCTSCLQEKLLFHPTKLAADHKYSFNVSFEEINYETDKNVKINSLYFKAKDAKGVVFYLHEMPVRSTAGAVLREHSRSTVMIC